MEYDRCIKEYWIVYKIHFIYILNFFFLSPVFID